MSIMISFRVSSDEARAIARAVRKSRANRGEYLRRVVFEAVGLPVGSAVKKEGRPPSGKKLDTTATSQL
jgi:hypothetical protein